DLRTHVVDGETGQRGFLLTGDESYLQPFTQAHELAERDYAAVRRLLMEEGGEDSVLLRSLIEQKFEELNRTIELRRSKGFDAAASVVVGNRGKELMDQIRKAIGELAARRNEILHER